MSSALLAPSYERTRSIFWQMLRAESKKLLRRRGVMAFTVLLTVGVVIVTFAILEIYHLSNPVKYTPIGGTSGFNKVILILSELTIIPTSILGSTAGSQDMESGVIRDMIVTGRSKMAVFMLRIEGSVAVWIIPEIVAYLVGVAIIFGFSGGNPDPALHQLIEGGLYCLGVSLAFMLTASGLASLFGTRGPAIAVMIGWTFVIESILLNVSALGPIRDAFLTTAISSLSPIPHEARRLKAAGVSPSLLVDYLTIIGWPLVMNVLGWIRLSRYEA